MFGEFLYRGPGDCIICITDYSQQQTTDALSGHIGKILFINQKVFLKDLFLVLPHFKSNANSCMCWKIICDMIKGNESDVGNIDFEL